MIEPSLPSDMYLLKLMVKKKRPLHIFQHAFMEIQLHAILTVNRAIHAIQVTQGQPSWNNMHELNYLYYGSTIALTNSTGKKYKK